MHLLPQGKTSAKPTTVQTGTFHNSFVNLLTHHFKMCTHILTSETQHLHAVLFKHSTAFLIILHSLFSIMLRAVKFNNQSCQRAIKIRHKCTNWPLFVHFHWICAQKRIPQLFLHGCHFMTQFLHTFTHPRVIGQVGDGHKRHLILPCASRAGSSEALTLENAAPCQGLPY